MSRKFATLSSRLTPLLMALSAGALLVVAFGCSSSGGEVSSPPLLNPKVTSAQVQQGRSLVLALGCSDCHNAGKDDPSDGVWLSGYHAGTPGQPFQIGPFKTYPANLTPDATGLGMHEDRQVYNALKYGLDPMDTPSVIITSATPGVGNFPATPHYLAPPMPWTAIRHLTDDQIWAIVGYLKHGIKGVNNTVTSSDSPPDFWASSYTDDKVGPANAPAYPANNEQFVP